MEKERGTESRETVATIIKVVSIVVIIACIIFFVAMVKGTPFFIGATDPNDINPDPNGTQKIPELFVFYMVDLTDGRYHVDFFQGTTHPYGDVNYDGMCDFDDVNEWNQMDSISRMTFRQKCYQIERKAKSSISRYTTYYELWQGFKKMENAKPVIMYVDPPPRSDS